MFPFFRSRTNSKKSPRRTTKRRRSIERLEERTVLSSYSVANLNDHGVGSLRQAILDANKHIGADTINFSVAGTITLASALPKITDTVNIDGTSAPGYAGAPLVEVDNHGFNGLVFNAKATGSDLTGLSIVNAKGSGVTLNGTHGTIIVGNYIGVALNGTVASNRGNGIELDNATANNIGGSLAQDRNIISGNFKNGILLNNSNSIAIFGNFLGTDASGTVDLGNGQSGVAITNSSTNNTVGGSTGNLISGNDAYGVLISSKSSLNTVSGNVIGLNASGTAALGNTLAGVKLDNAKNNTIGQVDPVTGVTYYHATSVVSTPAVNGWQGLRGTDNSGEYYITGTAGDDAILYTGPIDGTGSGITFMYPGQNITQTTAYGPDNLGSGSVGIVGTYKDSSNPDVAINGFAFQGTTADLTNETQANFQTIDYPDATYTYVHSLANGLAVGNYDSAADHGKGNLPYGPGHAFIYDVNTQTFLTDVVFPNSKSNTVYGIWYNGGTSYTLAGGYSAKNVNNFDDQSQPIGEAFMVDYDAATGKFTNWTSFNYPFGKNLDTHFEGISSVESGVYTLSADSVQAGTNNPVQASFVSVRRNADGSFDSGTWVKLSYGSGYITSNDSVYGNQVVGVAFGGGNLPVSFQATINVGFQLSNVISGNGGNGIFLSNSSGNTIAMNYIGTDSTGTIDLGNGANGILLAAGSTNNLIGGEATGGNNPTGGGNPADAVFVVPPQGNLISGNNGDGVLITDMSTQNQLSGNFIGTDLTGNTALANSGDGVAILNANDNSLIGCTFQQNPFVFYNVISGNDGNGLVVNDSDNTTIQANFFGMGADNNTALGNALNGVLVEGTSAHTVMGGPIPLGNVDAANGQNGIVVQDKASYFTSYNTFCGIAAFSTVTTFGNGADGMLFTTTGGHNLIRTNVVSENDENGIEVTGSAKDIDIVGNIIGLDTYGTTSMGNAGSGIKVDGNAHDISIGGPQPTFNVIPQNTISSNAMYGVDIEGTAHNIAVNHSYIGTDVLGVVALGNAEAGVSVGDGTYSNTIGSTDANLLTIISGNIGNGITLSDTHDNTVQGTYLGVDCTGAVALGNGGNGIDIVNSSNNAIGGTSLDNQNIIANNAASGVLVQSGIGNSILHNSIYNNSALGIDLLSGANNNQAAPVLNSVDLLSQNTRVIGTLTSTPKTTFTIEFFANSASGANGQVFLGSIKVKTDATGLASFVYIGPSLPTGDIFVTSTATDLDGNTSEFSNAVS